MVAKLAPAFTVTVDGMASATLLDCSGTNMAAGAKPLSAIALTAARVSMSRSVRLSFDWYPGGVSRPFQRFENLIEPIDSACLKIARLLTAIGPKPS